MEAVLLAQGEIEGAAAAGVFLIFGLFYLAFIVLMIAAFWKVFTKAGEPGWAAIVPIYNLVVLLRIAGRPVWWVLLFIIPLVNLVIIAITYIDLAKSFGKDAAFAIGLIFLSPIFFPILGFGDSRYLGPAGPEPRPGYPSLGQGGYGQPYGGQQYGAPQGGYTPPPGQSWGQPPAGGQQWGQQPAQPQGWGDGGGGQQWGQPQQPQWGQPPGGGSTGGQDYPPPPVGQ